MSAISEVIVRIDSIKLKRKYYSNAISLNWEGTYYENTSKPYSSEVVPFVSGEILGVPYSNALVSIEIRMFKGCEQDLNKENNANSKLVFVGKSILSINRYVSTEYSTALELDIVDIQGSIIGKLVGMTAVHVIEFKDRHDNGNGDDSLIGITSGIKQYPLRKFS